MAKKKCRVVHVEIGKRMLARERAVNRDLKKLGIAITDLRLFEAKRNGKREYAFGLSRTIKESEYAKIRAVLRKHLGVQKKGA